MKHKTERLQRTNPDRIATNAAGGKQALIATNAAGGKQALYGSTLWGIAVFLVAINLLTYASVWNFGFVNYDDTEYILANPNVNGRLTSHSVLWAFTTGYNANWHPLTWLSHMADVQLYGLNSGGHHLTNLLFHIANTLLLFWVLFRMTGASGPCVFVAALFAVHPLHVESVAWVAERKDVLSTFLWMLTLYAYVVYVERRQLARYLAVLMLFALGLMAKPMLVTLPFVLLLLDYWPLGRITLDQRSNLPKLFLEKIPLIVLAGGASIVTIMVQGGAIAELAALPISNRVASACIAYFAYMWKTVWPRQLAVLYPMASTIPDWWLAAALGLIALSILSIRTAPQRPYIFVGWFWYLGTLVPVIGLIQVGRQAMADRYTYVPLIGLFLIIVFGVPDALRSLRARKILFAAGGAIAIVGCMAVANAQVQYWRSSETLWQHTIAMTRENSVAHHNLANVLMEEERLDEAKYHYLESLRIRPGYALTHFQLANLFTKIGDSDRAIAEYSESLRLDPQRAMAHYNLGALLENRAKQDEASSHFLEALRIQPNFPEAHTALGVHDAMQGRLDQAIAHFAEAIRLKPEYAVAHSSLATVLANQGSLKEAISEFNEAVRLDPGSAEAQTNLGILLAKQGRSEEAIAHLSDALRINKDNQLAQTWLAVLRNNKSSTR